MEPTIKNLIFDLGAVLLNIDVPRTARALTELAGRDLTWVEGRIVEFGLFSRYETGQWTDAEFRDQVRTAMEAPVGDEPIDAAWNALLLDFPPERIELLRRLKPQYRTFMLSNTSAIHFRQVERILRRDTGYPTLHDLFEKVYLSFEMKKLKPSPAIYEQVLRESGLQPSETLFFDDNLANVNAAKQLGIQTVHIQETVTILDYFPNAPTQQ
ncbi:MAG: HAD family phosphatase [Ferruginibacter sp.]|nr:HAD family phosphatase [Cytophagales bacterium]